MFWVNQLVGSLLHGQRRPDEIIVVDQTPKTERSSISYQEMGRYLKRHDVKYIYNSVANASVARNKGAQASTGEILVFLDDDVFLPEFFLKEYDTIFRDPSVGAATGMVLVHSKDDGTFKPLIIQESLPTKPNMIRGGNFAIRRSVFMQVGGMDEQFVRGCHHEDWDFAWRVHEAGVKAVWSPGPWCYHAAISDGGGRWKFFKGFADRVYNIAYFHLRHPGALGSKTALFKHILRQFILNSENLQHPWLLPKAAWITVFSCRKASAAARQGPRLIKNNSGHNNASGI